MLSTKRRLTILLLVILGASISVGSILSARFLDLGTNVQDPLYFDSTTRSVFEYNNGTDVVNLQFNSVFNTPSYQAEVGYGSPSNFLTYNVTSDGRFIDNTQETDNYSIFWVHIIESGTAGSELQQQVGRNFSIWDNYGILGALNTEYVLTITAQNTYWPLEGPLHGAQFSLVFEVRTLSDVLVATGEMDYTCGMLFFLNIGTGNLATLKLVDTNYDISRNRLTGFPVVIISSIAIPVALFLYLKYKRKEEMDKIIDTTFLVAMGGAIITVDFFVDIWMYAPLGRTGNLLLHLGLVAAFAAFSFWRKYDLKWGLIPGFLEVAYVFTITWVTGDSYVPHLTAFMGLTLTWLILIWASGVKHYEAKGKLGKLVKQFV